jgi:ketosteroid isomerase-like protein
MRLLILGAGLLTVLAAPSWAAGHSRVRAEAYIRDSESQWAESVATGDASVLRRILADDFVWVLDGRILDKAQAIKEAAAGPGPFLSDHVDYVHIRFYGDTAVAQGSETWAKKGGVRGRFIWTDTWVLRHGEWRIVSAEDLVAPPAP